MALNILTFDLEDWFHLLEHPATQGPAQWASFPSRLEENTERLMMILNQAQCSATFFVLGWVAEKYPLLIKKILQAGHHIGCHSHAHQLIHQQGASAFELDLKRALGALGDITGQSITAFRAPGFSLTENTPWAFEILAAAGIKYDSSVFPSRRAHGGHLTYPVKSIATIQIPNQGQIREFPILPAAFCGRDLIYSGGGYFRLLPGSALHYFFRKAPYNMTYFHPRDFDPAQPLIPGLGPLRKFKSYYGLKSAQAKLQNLLQSFRFLSLQQAIPLINWAHYPTLSLNSNGSFQIQNIA